MLSRSPDRDRSWVPDSVSKRGPERHLLGLGRAGSAQIAARGSMAAPGTSGSTVGEGAHTTLGDLLEGFRSSAKPRVILPHLLDEQRPPDLDMPTPCRPIHEGSPALKIRGPVISQAAIPRAETQFDMPAPRGIDTVGQLTLPMTGRMPPPKMLVLPLLIFALIGSVVGIVRLYRRGYMCWGIRFYYRRIYRKDEPRKFWTLFCANAGVITALLALTILVFLRYPS